MNDSGRDLKNLRRPLPDLRLPRISGGEPVRTRARGRKSPVLLIRHPAGCAACDEYLKRLAGHREEIEEWDGRVLVVLPEVSSKADTTADSRDETFAVVVDSGGRLVSALSIDLPALLIADQWGEIHLVEQAGAEHRFPTGEEVVEWLRYLAIHCPECEGEVL